jgi:hypothetical protein
MPASSQLSRWGVLTVGSAAMPLPALLARDAPGDRERTQVLLDSALATYRELGMEIDTARIPALGREDDIAAR